MQIFKSIKELITVLCALIIFPVVAGAAAIRRRAGSGRADKKILVIDNAKIGDMVCATPVFRAIKKAYPDSRLAVLINPKTAGILKRNPHIDEIVHASSSFGGMVRLFAKMASWRFTGSVALVPGTMNYLLPYILCTPVRSTATAPEYGWFYRSLALICSTSRKRLHPDELSVKHYLDMLAPLGIRDGELAKEVFYTAEAKQNAQKFLVKSGWKKDSKLVGITLSAGNKIKEWPAERFIEVAELIYKKHLYVPVFLGAPNDRQKIERHVEVLQAKGIPYIIAAESSLEDLPALMSFLSYFVSVDTGTLYIANALGIPVVDIAGPCNIYDQMPIYEKCEVVYIKGLPGWPYSSVLKTATRLDDRQMRCITDVTPGMVFEAFEKLHSQYPASHSADHKQ